MSESEELARICADADDWLQPDRSLDSLHGLRLLRGLLSHCRRLLAELAAEREKVKALRGYVRHKSSCTCARSAKYCHRDFCNCGLTALLEDTK